MKFKIAILTALVILAGIISLHPGVALLTGNYIITSSGSISYIPTRPLHVEGRYIKDDQNRTVFLRGVNGGGWVDTYAGGFPAQSDMWTWEPDAIKANLDAMKSWGINCIRGLIVCDWWKNNYMNYRQNYKDFLTWAAERGMYVIVAFYQVLGYVEGGEGWTDFPYPPYVTSAAARAIIPNEQAFVDIWASVAQELAGFPNILFDLWNEVGADYDVNSQQMTHWWTVAQSCINAIRRHTQAPIDICYGWGIACDLDWPSGAGTLAWVQTCPLTDPAGNLIYDTHIYRDGGGLGYWSEAGGRAYLRPDIEQAWNICKVNAVGEQWNKPLMFGEIGCNLDYELSQELTGFQNALQIANEWNIHYCAWIWWGPDVSSYALLSSSQSLQFPTSQSGQILIDAISAT